jgi:hypothetical protein
LPRTLASQELKRKNKKAWFQLFIFCGKVSPLGNQEAKKRPFYFYKGFSEKKNPPNSPYFEIIILDYRFFQVANTRFQKISTFLSDMYCSNLAISRHVRRIIDSF